MTPSDPDQSAESQPEGAVGTAKRPPIVFVSPSKYVQGPGALDELHEHVRGLGTRATVVVSRSGWDRLEERLTRAFAAAGIELHTFVFSGESSLSQIDGAAALAAETRSDLVVGVGGGKATDTAKAVAARIGSPVVIVPTTASTDAPTSSLTVVYTDEGEWADYILHGRSPDLVLMDSQIVADAGPRFLAAGMADAVSTRFESAACAASGALNISGGRPSAAALALGALTWDNIRAYGRAALTAVERRAVTPALELIIETNTLHSGLGFESGGFSAAHSVHNGLTTVPEAHGALHGEKVNFGVLTMLVLQGRPDAELDEYVDLSVELGLPITLRDLGVTELSEQALHVAAERTVAEGESIHLLPFPVTAEMVAAAIQGADAYAKAYVEDR